MLLLLFFLGAFTASTLICFIERTPKQFCYGRSQCNYCLHPLK